MRSNERTPTNDCSDRSQEIHSHRAFNNDIIPLEKKKKKNNHVVGVRKKWNNGLSKKKKTGAHSLGQAIPIQSRRRTKNMQKWNKSGFSEREDWCSFTLDPDSTRRTWTRKDEKTRRMFVTFAIHKFRSDRIGNSHTYTHTHTLWKRSFWPSDNRSTRGKFVYQRQAAARGEFCSSLFYPEFYHSFLVWRGGPRDTSFLRHSSCTRTNECFPFQRCSEVNAHTFARSHILTSEYPSFDVVQTFSVSPVLFVARVSLAKRGEGAW